MQFETMGGYPPIIRDDDAKINEKTLESRGFAITNIVNINNIMELKKKDNLYVAFGSPSDEETGFDYNIEAMLDTTPHDYKNISYKKISHKLKK